MQRFAQVEGNKSFEIKLFLLFITLGLGALLFDLFTPLGFGVWVLYLVFIFIYRSYSNCRFIYQLVIFYSVNIIIAFIFAPRGLPEIYPLINRVAAICTMFIVAYVSSKEKEVKKINAEILERISDSFLALDNQGNITYANKFSLVVSGKEELIGKNIWQEFPNLQNTLYHEKILESIKKQAPVEFRMQSLNSHHYYQVSAYPSSRGVSVFAKNITELEKAENHLRAALKEKELLLKEIHHRIKNNFQLVSSLLGLSTANIDDPTVKETVSLVQQRIRTLAIVHEKLYQSDNLSSIALKTFLEELFSSFSNADDQLTNYIKTDLAVENITLNLETAIPIGMILTELYTNSLKHAFREKENCKVSVNMNYLDGSNSRLQMVYRDNGKGLPDQLDIHNTDSLGFTIITSFVDQLNGDMTFRNNNGAEFIFIFKIKSW